MKTASTMNDPLLSKPDYTSVAWLAVKAFEIMGKAELLDAYFNKLKNHDTYLRDSKDPVYKLTRILTAQASVLAEIDTHDKSTRNDVRHLKQQFIDHTMLDKDSHVSGIVLSSYTDQPTVKRTWNNIAKGHIVPTLKNIEATWALKQDWFLPHYTNQEDVTLNFGRAARLAKQANKAILTCGNEDIISNYTRAETQWGENINAPAYRFLNDEVKYVTNLLKQDDRPQTKNFDTLYDTFEKNGLLTTARIRVTPPAKIQTLKNLSGLRILEAGRNVVSSFNYNG